MHACKQAYHTWISNGRTVELLLTTKLSQHKEATTIIIQTDMSGNNEQANVAHKHKVDIKMGRPYGSTQHANMSILYNGLSHKFGDEHTNSLQSDSSTNHLTVHFLSRFPAFSRLPCITGVTASPVSVTRIKHAGLPQPTRHWAITHLTTTEFAVVIFHTS